MFPLGSSVVTKISFCGSTVPLDLDQDGRSSALPRAQLPSQEAGCRFRLGVERSKLGQYAEAVADYDRQVGSKQDTAA